MFLYAFPLKVDINDLVVISLFLGILKKAVVYCLVGETGLEPATSRPPAVRASRLRHSPIFCDQINGQWFENQGE